MQRKKRKREEKTTPLGVNSLRTQELYRAAQVMQSNLCYVGQVGGAGSAQQPGDSSGRPGVQIPQLAGALD